MADWGMKISKPGYDVKTCTDDQLVFSSKLNTFKIAYSASPTSSGTYSHGLSYAPAFIVAGNGFFVGQEYSSFEAIYYCTSSLFYYWDACRYWLFYQEG
jgi:hypothetical protein